MVVAEHVQHAVHDEARELFAHRDAASDRIGAGHVGTDVDVAHDGIGV